MKKHIIAAFIALTAVPAFLAKADSASYSLLVNTIDGNTVEYAFEYLPVATFEGNEMIISDDRSSSTTRCVMDDVVNMTFQSKGMGVENIEGAALFKVSLVNDMLNVAGLSEGESVVIYDATGKMAASATADSDGSVSINIGNLGKGVYVASMPKQSFKFIR